MAHILPVGVRMGLALLPLLAVAAAAQDAAAPGGAPPAAQRDAWGSQCTAAAREAPLECSIEQRLFMQDTAQRLATVTVKVPNDTRKPVMMLQAPLGLYLPAGIAVDVDGKLQQKFEIQTCDANGCYAGAPISEELLAGMFRGQGLNMSLQNLARQTITVTATLVGFTAAYQRVR